MKSVYSLYLGSQVSNKEFILSKGFLVKCNTGPKDVIDRAKGCAIQEHSEDSSIGQVLVLGVNCTSCLKLNTKDSDLVPDR